MKRITVIINKLAGSVEQEQTRTNITSAFEKLECVLTIVEARGADITNVAKKTIPSSDVVVAAGGDGTMNAVATALNGTDATMGVLPLGTLNHFAKDLNIPQEIHEAATTIVNGKPELVDVAFVNDTLFLNNSSIGIYPSMVRDRDEQQQRTGRSKWPAMFIAALSAFRNYRTFAVRIKTPTETFITKTPFVFVGNNIYSTTLTSLGTRDGLADGMLCVFVLKNPTRWRLVSTIFDVIRGTLEQSEDFELYTVEELWLSMKRKSTHASFDGEVQRFTTPLHYRISPASLRVMLP